MGKTLIKASTLFVMACAIVLSFQNCSPVQFGGAEQSSEELGGTDPTTGEKTCSFNGNTYRPGEYVRAFAQSTVAFGSSCQSEQRRCLENGQLSGSYPYAVCSVGSAQACILGTYTIPHGTSVTRYASSSVAVGGQCASQVRSCNNGVLSGSYQAVSCTVQTASSCVLNGVAVNHGETVVRYASASVPFGGTCQSQVRTCNNGSLSGSYSAVTCSVQGANACSFAGQSVQHGSSVTAYAAANVPNGSTCVAQTRTCSNGVLSGSYQNANCSVEAPPVPICSVSMPLQIMTTDNLRITVSASNAARIEVSCDGAAPSALNNGINDVGVLGEGFLGNHQCVFKAFSTTGASVACNPASRLLQVICPSGMAVVEDGAGRKSCRSTNNYNRWCFRGNDGARFFTIPAPGAFHAPGCGHQDDGKFYAPGVTIPGTGGTLTCVSQGSPIADSLCQ